MSIRFGLMHFLIIATMTVSAADKAGQKHLRGENGGAIPSLETQTFDQGQDHQSISPNKQLGSSFMTVDMYNFEENGMFSHCSPDFQKSISKVIGHSLQKYTNKFLYQETDGNKGSPQIMDLVEVDNNVDLIDSGTASETPSQPQNHGHQRVLVYTSGNGHYFYRGDGHWAYRCVQCGFDTNDHRRQLMSGGRRHLAATRRDNNDNPMNELSFGETSESHNVMTAVTMTNSAMNHGMPAYVSHWIGREVGWYIGNATALTGKPTCMGSGSSDDHVFTVSFLFSWL